MKLFELITTQNKTIQSKSDFDFYKMNKDRDIESTGPESGAYAIGSQDKKDPHMYNKKHFLPSNLENDGYYQYVKAIQPYMAENPYFPRVYVVKLTKDSKGNILPEYKMEKLSPANEFSFSSILAMAKKMFKEFPDIPSGYNSHYIMSVISRNLLSATSIRDFSNIADDNLKSALLLIDKIIESNDMINLDLHANNIMIRGTQIGPQLVITDPLYDEGGNSRVGLKRGF